MKRLVLIDILWLGLVLLAGLTWSQHDQSEYADRLDHYGVTEQAHQLTTRSQQTLATSVQALAKADVTGVTIEYQPKAEQGPIYIYSHRDTQSLPLTSGQWFSDADLQSPLPVVVVGTVVAKTLYTGSTQQYYQQNGAYLPVLGIVGTRTGSPLNKAVFMNASAATSERLSHYRIIVDGKKATTQLGTIEKIMKTVTSSRYQYVSTSQQNDWWENNGATFMTCVGLAVLAVLLAIGTMWLIQPKVPTGLTTAMKIRFQRGLLSQALTHVAIASVIGSMFVTWWLYFTSPWRLWAFVAFAWVLFGLILRQGIHWFDRHQERKRTNAANRL